MARMVATKAALSIRVDALTDADDKSEPTAPTIGIENRAKLEARLRALEEGADAAGVRGARNGKKQPKFSMNGETSTYNTAADAVDLVPAQRDPLETAIQATLDVKAEKKKAKEEKKAKHKAKKEESEDEDGEAKPKAHAIPRTLDEQSGTSPRIPRMHYSPAYLEPHRFGGAQVRHVLRAQ